MCRRTQSRSAPPSAFGSPSLPLGDGLRYAALGAVRGLRSIPGTSLPNTTLLLFTEHSTITYLTIPEF